MPFGIVSVVYGPRCEVLDQGRSLPCLLRGRLKQSPAGLAAGDRVEYRRVDDRQGVVERVLERRSELARSSRDSSRRRVQGRGSAPRQVVLANPDQVVFVAAARDPGIDFALMDRALALARTARLPAAICVNKVDLAPVSEIARLMRPYEQLGVAVLYLSALEARGLEPLRALLAGKTSFFWGGSGVGKSSLIRALTGAEVRVGRWRTDNPRGPHTTNVTRLYPLETGGLIADTPGFDWLELDTVYEQPQHVPLLLPEAAAFSPGCRFPGCTHAGEPECAVMAAVLSGEIDRARYARFRAAMAEESPPKRLPVEIAAAGDELLFRMREGGGVVWTSFQMHHVFQPEAPEREGLLEALGAPLNREAAWIVFHEEAGPAPRGGRMLLAGKVSAAGPVEDWLRPEAELILRERGAVKGIARVREVRSASTPWRLRKPLRGTPVYEGRAFWTDVKPPRGVALPPVEGAYVRLSVQSRFDQIPSLALGAITRQETGLVADFLEVGSSDDETTRE